MGAATARRAVITAFLCPTDPDPISYDERALPVSGCLGDPGTPDGSGANLFRGTVTHYVGSYGDGYNNGGAADPYAWEGAGARYGCGGCNSDGRGTPTADCPSPTGAYGSGRNHRGLFDYTSTSAPVRLAGVRDGTSNTILFGHTAGIVRSNSLVWFSSTGAINGTSLPINWTLLRSVRQGRPFGSSWTGRGFTSHHPGGTTVALTDGSVRFLAETINQRVFNALGSRAGGEVVSADQF
jgi:hypothetical protein